MHGDAGTVIAGCGCRACLGNRAWLRRMERDVVADLRRQSVIHIDPVDRDEAGPGDGDAEIVGGFKLIWTTRVRVSTSSGSLSAVSAALMPRLQGAFARENGVYEFFFGDRLAYVGRTKNIIKNRVGAHFNNAQRLDPMIFSLPATECDTFDLMLSTVCATKLWSTISVRCADKTKISLPRGQGLDFDVKGSHALELLLQDKHRADLAATVSAFLRALTAKDASLSAHLAGKLIGYNRNTAYFENE
jgi:hypothetical protein